MDRSSIDKFNLLNFKRKRLLSWIDKFERRSNEGSKFKQLVQINLLIYWFWLKWLFLCSPKCSFVRNTEKLPMMMNSCFFHQISSYIYEEEGIKVVILKWLPCWSKEARFKLLYNTTLVLMRTPEAVHTVLDHILCTYVRTPQAVKN